MSELKPETKFRILLIEDEKNLGLTLQERLASEGFAVNWCKNVAESKDEISQRRFDLAILDVGLPDGNGFEVAEFLRKRQKSCAMIFLTAFGTPEDRVRGLELGAEDYIVKPFHLKELVLRVHNALKRARFAQPPTEHADAVHLGKATVHFSSFTVQVDGESQTLTQKECALLKLLYDRRGEVVSRDEILNFIWSDEEFPSPRTVDNFILRLRRLTETDPEHPILIRSIRGVGYRLEVEK